MTREVSLSPDEYANFYVFVSVRPDDWHLIWPELIQRKEVA